MTLELFRKVRAKLGASTPLGARISGEADAEIFFGSLADAGADFIHLTEFQAWKSAFGENGPTWSRSLRSMRPRQ